MYEFTKIDYFVLLAVLLVSILIGLYHAIKTKWPQLFWTQKEETNSLSQIREYLVASSSMTFLPVAFSMLATVFSATALLGFPVEIYQYGIQHVTSIAGMMTTPIIGALITGPMFARINVMSVFEYFKLRYDSNTVRLLAVTCYVIRSVISLAVFIFGPSTTVTTITGISIPVAIVIIGAVSTFYTCIGGIKAVIWTDVFQLTMMFTGLVTIIAKGVYDVGGFGEIWRINEKGGRLNYFDFDPNPFVRQNFWSLYIGMATHFTMAFAIDQTMVQRFAAAKNIRSAQIALLLNVPGILLLTGMCSLSGLVIYATYAKCDPLSAPSITGVKNPNQLLSYFVTDRLKVINGIVGLFLASILSGSLSSISSSLNSLAAIVLEDFLKRFRYFKTLSDGKTTLAAKLIVVVCGVLGTCLALVVSKLGGNLLQLSTTLNGAFNSPVLGVFILASVFPFSNSCGAVMGLIFGFAMALWVNFSAFIKKPIYPKLAVGTECYGANFTTTSNSNITLSDTMKEALNLHGVDKIYSLSYLWFTPIGVFTTVLFGVIFSLISGCNKKQVHSDLLVFKCLTRFQKKKMGK